MNNMVLLGFVVALAFVLISIIKFNLHPFLSLLVGGLLMGAVSGLGLVEIANGLASGFGGTMTGIGILIILGVILGEILHQSGCMEEIANLFITKLGKNNSPLALNLTGYIVSIPVFFDAAFVILVNLAKSISKKGKIPFVTLVTALGVGLITTHAMVIPTPGPTSVAGTMGANIGWFILYSIIASLPGSVAAGVVYAKHLGKTDDFKDNFAQAFDDEEVAEVKSAPVGPRPSGGLGIMLILFPIIVILVGTVATMMIADKESAMYTFFAFIGNKNIALLLGVIVAYAALKKYLPNDLNEITTSATIQSGSILAITGAGGAFGQIIGLSKIGDVVVNMLSGMTGSSAGVMVIIVAFLVSALLRLAQGSTTVALVTTSAIFAPIVAGLTGTSAILVGLAICAGGIGFSLPNDSGFWVVNRFSKFDVKQTFKAWTVAGSISSIVNLVVIIILSFFVGVLPGLI